MFDNIWYTIKLRWVVSFYAVFNMYIHFIILKDSSIIHNDGPRRIIPIIFKNRSTSWLPLLCVNNFETISFKVLIISLLIFIFLEIIEFLLSMLTVKLYGGKISSSFLSVIGGFVGAFIINFIFPIIGACIGLILGSYMTVYFIEKKSGKKTEEALKIANSTTIGYIISKCFKTSGIIFLGIYILNLIN